MSEFWFYLKLGLDHVLDFAAYDHILFLSVLAIPFTFKTWKKVVVLATVFTIAHCLSLALSAFEILEVDVSLIEFLIPVTIVLTAIYNIIYVRTKIENRSILFHAGATALFGLIHGFGFSNYFKMLMVEEEDKVTPLLGFASGIELSQLSIILSILMIAFLTQEVAKLKQSLFIIGASIVIIFITIPILIETFPF
ncbi:HupE/UreJ family protein [Cellulophaga baltica]|uniref:HupE/UreJ family protein n=1 Tax=Cellulophaga TaxID=104264 RepID=UPI001C06DA9C|nr:MULTISPECIES: HupE/UreJ family protein [Cellulophaga]MBU2997634.1 HupE/UreJ family protein [Cellulophaga baltica]MDO6769029.1 HupE/UreJ family protein [Cellulophaga sp. 1_MG-2023]